MYLQNNSARKLLAEFVATFSMVFLGTGAIVWNDMTNGQLGSPGIALTFGGVITAMIYLLGPISGAHMNPAVSIAVTVDKRLPKALLLPYILSQCAGAIFASYLLSLFFPHHSTLGSTTPQGSIVQSFVVEFFLGLVLVFAILQIINRASLSRLTGAFIVGAIVGLAAMFFGHISGASINPTRSLAPAIISGRYLGLWIYLLAPTAGGLLAVHICKRFETAVSPYLGKGALSK